MAGPSITILLPAYNEEKALTPLLKEIKERVVDSYQLLVIDNASTDNTLHTALDGGARVLTVETKGKGNAIRESLRALDTPYTIMMNSDMTYPPEYVRLIYRELRLGADVVMGTRAIVDKGAMSNLHSLGNWGLSRLASLLYQTNIEDLCTGMWGFKTSTLLSFDLTSTHFTLEADLFVNAVKHKCKIRQVPVGYRARLNGDKAKLHALDGARIAWFLLRSRWKKYGN